MPELTMQDATSRTKQAVAKWSKKSPSDILLEDKLDDVRSGAYSELRAYVNDAFDGQTGYPIRAGEWSGLAFETVRAVRDDAMKRTEP